MHTCEHRYISHYQADNHCEPERKLPDCKCMVVVLNSCQCLANNPDIFLLIQSLNFRQSASLQKISTHKFEHYVNVFPSLLKHIIGKYNHFITHQLSFTSLFQRLPSDPFSSEKKSQLTSSERQSLLLPVLTHIPRRHLHFKSQSHFPCCMQCIA